MRATYSSYRDAGRFLLLMLGARDANSAGSCHTDTGDVPTMDGPCELEAVDGTFVEALP